MKLRGKLSSYKFTLFNIATSLLDEYKNSLMVSDLCIYFLAYDARQTNRIFNSTGVKGTFNGEDYSSVAMAFLLIATFIDRTTRYPAEANLLIVHTLYSDLKNYLIFRLYQVISPSVYSYNIFANSQKIDAVA